ncbi:MAG: hypothetical protein AAF697_03650 [Pseudomonadota bacterium]
MLDWWLLWRVPVLALIVMAAWWFGFRPIAMEQGWVEVTEDFALCGGEGPTAAGCVVDGDTLVIGFGSERRRIRLTGFDAPELEGACGLEEVLAQSAKEELHKWLGEGPFEWNGDADPPRDQYGRELRAARRILPDGSRDYLADAMIATGLAAESGWGTTPRDWCE